MSNSEKSYHFFFRTKSPFSQWYPCKFINNNILFSSAEQAMMYRKAKLFGDSDIAKKILLIKDPKKIKILGRAVKNFNESVWKKHRELIVYEINMCKFAQNLRLKKYLLSINHIIVEASPYDRIWGIGYSKKNAMRNKHNWGLNLLGNAIMKVRKNLSIDLLI